MLNEAHGLTRWLVMGLCQSALQLPLGNGLQSTERVKETLVRDMLKHELQPRRRGYTAVRMTAVRLARQGLRFMLTTCYWNVIDKLTPSRRRGEGGGVSGGGGHVAEWRRHKMRGSSSPLKNVCHGCVSRADVGKRAGPSHCRHGSGTQIQVVQRAVAHYGAIAGGSLTQGNSSRRSATWPKRPGHPETAEMIDQLSRCTHITRCIRPIRNSFCLRSPMLLSLDVNCGWVAGPFASLVALTPCRRTLKRELQRGELQL